LHTQHMQRLHILGHAHSMQCHAEKRCLSSMSKKSNLKLKFPHAPSERAAIGLCQLFRDATSSRRCSASAWQIRWPYTSRADSAHFCWPYTSMTNMGTYHGIVSCVIFLDPASVLGVTPPSVCAARVITFAQSKVRLSGSAAQC